MNVKVLVINGVEFSYEDESDVLSYENISSISHNDAKDVLFKTKELFEEISLRFSLAFGTLLGAIRENDIIAGDEDVDVMIEDEEKLYNNIPYLYSKGLKLCRIHKGLYYSFRINDCAYIDVYIIRNIKSSIWGCYCYSLAGYVTPKKYFKEYTNIKFLGEDFIIPKCPEKILEFWYGKKWNIPQKGHDFIYEVKSAYYWRKLKRSLKLFVKYIIGWKYCKNK